MDAPRIAEWPLEDRPRERLYDKGAEALADAELLAIQLGAGVRGQRAVEVARGLLVRHGSLSAVAARPVVELAAHPGVGRARAARLAAAFELTRRLRSRNGGSRVVLASPEQVYARYGPLMEDLHKEVFRAALLDAQNGLLRDVIVSEGTLSASLVHPREVFKPAILEPAASVILLHDAHFLGVKEAVRTALAKEASKAALQSLRDVDSFGLVAFDYNSFWPVTLQPKNMNTMAGAIDRIVASGETNAYPALEQAFVELSASKSDI
jgi:DNA repair protein RadC